MKAPPPNENDQLARLKQEIEERTWVENAGKRARRRKSPWNIPLPLFSLPLWCALSFLLSMAAAGLHTLIHPAAAPLFASGPLRLGAALVLFPILISTICPALLLTNFLLCLIPAARRAMEAEDSAYPGTDYASSQRGLSKLGFWVCAACLPIVLIGVSIF